MICPCQNLQANPVNYEKCCKPYHDGLIAKKAEALMRSRFSAYVLGLYEYLKKTWHISTCPQPLELEPDSQWIRLDIISVSNKQVHFKAYFKEDSEFKYLEESSNFIQQDKKLVYLDGKTKVGTAHQNRNDFCLCGSGKKYKKCCAQ